MLPHTFLLMGVKIPLSWFLHCKITDDHITKFSHRVCFCSLLPELSGEQFSLLPYKPCHSGVIWTEEKAGNSEFTRSAAWFKPLHKVIQRQNILKTRRNKQAK